MYTTTEKLAMFRQLITCTKNIVFSEFDKNSVPIYCSSPNANAIHLFLAIDGITCVEDMPTLSIKKCSNQSIQKTTPIIRTNSLGMIWISESEYLGNELLKVHVLGPVFPNDYSSQNIGKKLDTLQISVALKREFLNFIDSLPIIPITRMYEYGIMLHYCLYEEKITISDFQHLEHTEAEIPLSSGKLTAPQYTYLTTKSLLDAVSDGNLQYKEILNKLSALEYTSAPANLNLLRQAKNSLIILTALCCQAAISGGLSPEIAYMLSDRYLQDIEFSTALPILTEISKTMLEDYVLRVHRMKCKSSISPQIQSVCNRISIHPEAEIDIHTLAHELGYADYYFSKKFKQETGITINEFIKREKIERAKTLLRDHAIPIQKIADDLGFHSQNYFGKQFKLFVGMTPTEYRNQ